MDYMKSMRKKLISKRKSTVRKPFSYMDRELICPDCGEGINCSDIEHFQKCPYCDCDLERNLELEDFILQPVVEHWISQYSIPLSDDGYYRSYKISGL